MSKEKTYPDCPLCGNKFEKKYLAIGTMLICPRDKISIWADDPCVGHWDEYVKDASEGDEEHLTCPNPKCRGKMNFFCNSGGLMKAICMNKIPQGGTMKACGGSISNMEEKDGQGNKGNIIV